MTQHDICRRPDGSIDIDFYRVQGEAERRHAMHRFARQTRNMAPTLRVAAAFIAGAYGIFARNTGKGLNVMAVTKKGSDIPHPDATAQLGSLVTR